MSGHPWASDPKAQEAIRRAEDDAAQWRRLEVGEVLQEGDEYLNCFHRWVPAMASSVGYPLRLSHSAHRRRRVPLPDHRELPAAVAELRERVARLEDHFADASKMVTPKPAPPLDHRFDWEKVANINKTSGNTTGTVARLTAERDAAIRHIAATEQSRRDAIRDLDAALEHCKKIEARVAELERAYSAECDARAQAHRELSDLADAIRNRESGEECDHSYAAQCRDASVARERADRMISAPAANAGGEARQEPVAWGVTWKDTGKIDLDFVYATKEEATETATEPGNNGTVVPLYAAPQPPRGWLTEEERRAIEAAVAVLDQRGRTNIGVALTALLARSTTPPKVKVPSQPAEFTLPRWNLCISRWTAAIRAAGGEVDE